MYRMDMPRQGKVNIPVNEETRDDLRDGKPTGVTWDRYLLKLKETSDYE
jgi:hypothetical protein